MLGRLRRNAPLPLGDGDDGHDDADEQTDEHEDFFQTDVAAGAAAAQREDGRAQMALLEKQALRRVGNAGDDAGHDDEADAVADAVFVDLLADPHEEDRADRHGDDGRELVIPVVIAAVLLAQVDGQAESVHTLEAWRYRSPKTRPG